MADKTPAVRKVIKISSIQQKPTQKGKMMWTITDDKDDFYSIFDEFVRARLTENQTVAVMVEINQRGDKAYKNIVGVDAEPVAAAGEVAVSDLLPGAKPTSSQEIQQPAAQASPTQPPAPALPTQKPLNVITSMVDIRIAALNASTRLCAAGIFTAAQIEHNSREFEKYLLGVGRNEHNNSSGSEGVDDYIA